MSPQRIVGLVLLVLGVVLLIIGYNASHSFADQMSNTFTGRFTQGTTWYIISGVVAGLVGLGMMFFGPGGRAQHH